MDAQIQANLRAIAQEHGGMTNVPLSIVQHVALVAGRAAIHQVDLPSFPRATVGPMEVLGINRPTMRESVAAKRQERRWW
jgi:hypothetical protein